MLSLIHLIRFCNAAFKHSNFLGNQYKVGLSEAGPAPQHQGDGQVDQVHCGAEDGLSQVNPAFVRAQHLTRNLVIKKQ